MFRLLAFANGGIPSVGDNRQPAPSRALPEGPARAPARSYLRNIGYTAQQLSQPIVGVSHSWTDTSPCNINHRDLADRVKAGVREAGGHVSPVAAAGGPIAALRDGDIIAIDVPGRQLRVEGADLAARSRPRRAPYQRNGALAHYALLVSSASQGAVLAGLDDADENQAGA